VVGDNNTKKTSLLVNYIKELQQDVPTVFDAYTVNVIYENKPISLSKLFFNLNQTKKQISQIPQAKKVKNSSISQN
jgi:hypothetical protein